MSQPLHQIILQDNNPLYILGCGTYAIDVYRYCIKYNITISGVVVNTSTDINVFLEHKVITLEQALHDHKKISIIIGFANFEKIHDLYKISGIEHIYYLPQVCYGCYSPIKKSFLNTNKLLIEKMYNESTDDLSKKCIESYFKMRSTDTNQSELEIFNYTESYFSNSLFKLSKNEVLIDIGSYKGATINQFLNASNNIYSKIIGIEPEQSNYNELKKNIRNQKNVLLFDCCIWKEDGYVNFSPDNDLGGITSTSLYTIEKEARSIDSLCDEYAIAPTIIEMNFPFSVVDILDGMKNTILKFYPKLILRVAYFEDTIIETYNYISEKYPKYNISFRYTQGIPQALTIFAIPKVSINS